MVEGISTAFDWGREVMAIAIILPLLWHKEKNQEKHLKKLQENQKERDKELLKTFENGFNWIQMAIWKTIIESSDVATEQASIHFQISAIDKIDFIQKRLQKNNTKERLKEILWSIDIECKRLDNEFVYRPLANFNTKAGNLGYILKENYDYDNFMLEIEDVIKNESNLEIKMTDVKTLLKSYQSKVIEEINLQFKNY